MQPRLLGMDAIDELEPTWRHWLASAPGATLYESPEYARYRFRELPPNFDGGLVVLGRQEQPDAIVPYRFQRSLAGIPTRAAQTFGLGVVPPDASPPEVSQVAHALRALRPFSIHVETAVATPPRDASFRGYAPLAGKDGLVPLGDTWDAFVEKQSGRFRKHLRHALRIREREGWELADVTRQGADAIERANALHDLYLNHRFPGYGGRYRSVWRDASFADVFAGRGLGVYALRRGDAVASILYGVRRDRTFYLFRQGNDPAYFDAFPDGVSLTLRAALLAQLIGQGVRTLDVVGGTEGLWQAEPNGRSLAVLASRAPHAALCRGAAHALMRQHRSSWMGVARRIVGRLSPRLASHAA